MVYHVSFDGALFGMQTTECSRATSRLSDTSRRSTDARAELSESPRIESRSISKADHDLHSSQNSLAGRRGPGSPDAYLPFL